MSTKQQGEKRKEGLRCYSSAGSPQHSRKLVYWYLLQKMRPSYVEEYNFTLPLRWNEMGWNDGTFFSITRPFTTLNCSSLPVAFSISSASLQITENELHCDSCALLSHLFSISISCEWNMWGSTFISHGFRSHNLIHLCDKLHYEGSQWCTALLIRPGTEPQPQPVTCALTHTHTGFLQHTLTHTSKCTSEVEQTY